MTVNAVSHIFCNAQSLFQYPEIVLSKACPITFQAAERLQFMRVFWCC